MVAYGWEYGDSMVALGSLEVLTDSAGTPDRYAHIPQSPCLSPVTTHTSWQVTSSLSFSAGDNVQEA